MWPMISTAGGGGGGAGAAGFTGLRAAAAAGFLAGVFLVVVAGACWAAITDGNANASKPAATQVAAKGIRVGEASMGAIVLIAAPRRGPGQRSFVAGA
jgi:hypothetical protein